MPTSRQQIGRYGALKSWANTTDRAARTARSRAAGPGELDWHLERLDAEKFADASEQQKLAAAESARKAYYAELAMRSAQSRQAKRPEKD